MKSLKKEASFNVNERKRSVSSNQPFTFPYPVISLDSGAVVEAISQKFRQKAKFVSCGTIDVSLRAKRIRMLY